VDPHAKSAVETGAGKTKSTAKAGFGAHFLTPHALVYALKAAQ
jgi:ATP-dependent phosphoenolpyruvate carboxykinase